MSACPQKELPGFILEVFPLDDRTRARMIEIGACADSKRLSVDGAGGTRNRTKVFPVNTHVAIVRRAGGRVVVVGERIETDSNTAIKLKETVTVGIPSRLTNPVVREGMRQGLQARAAVVIQRRGIDNRARSGDVDKQVQANDIRLISIDKVVTSAIDIDTFSVEAHDAIAGIATSAIEKVYRISAGFVTGLRRVTLHTGDRADLGPDHHSVNVLADFLVTIEVAAQITGFCPLLPGEVVHRTRPPVSIEIVGVHITGIRIVGLLSVRRWGYPSEGDQTGEQTT